MKNMYKMSTAMVLALSLANPGPLFAQSTLEVLRSGEAGPDDVPVCSDGTMPVCAEGEAVLTFGEMVDLVNSGNDDGIALMTTLEGDAESSQAFCTDGEIAMCEASAEILVPGNDDYQQAALLAMQAEAAEAAGSAEPADAAMTAEAEPEAPATEVVGEGSTTMEMEGTVTSEEMTEAAEAEAEAEVEVTAESEVTAEGSTDAAALAKALAAEEAVANEAEAEAVAEAEAMTETETVAEGEATAEAEAMAEAEAEVMDQGEAKMEAEEAAAANPEGRVVMDGAEGREEEANQVLQTLGATFDAADGEAATTTAAAAALDGEVETENTTEVEITEEDTRQSDEDFDTTASGKVNATASSNNDRGMSNFEKAALVGLGILAVGALLKNGDRVVANTGDRVIVQRGDNNYYVLKDDDALLRQPGATVRTETFSDGSTRSVVTREDGSKIITIRDASGRVLRRVRENEDGTRVVLIDDTETYERVVVSTLPEIEERIVVIERTDPESVRAVLERASAKNVGRVFSLRQIRDIERVRKLVPEIALDEVNFETASAAIRASEAEELARLGDLMRAMIEDNPSEVFLIEGHTDAVGRGSYNLALSDRRAESVALALTEYFDVPPENMVVQGYGESDLKVPTLDAERENRRVSVRRITPLLIDRVASR